MEPEISFLVFSSFDTGNCYGCCENQKDAHTCWNPYDPPLVYAISFNSNVNSVWIAPREKVNLDSFSWLP